MKKHNFLQAGLVLLVALSLGACANKNESKDTSSDMSSSSSMSQMDSMSSSGMSMDETSKMNMNGSAAPADLKNAVNPKFPVGSEITITADHMPGMKGASGKVVGVYDTKLYTVDYMDTEDHQMVTNHKYLIADEIKGDLTVGSKITLEADHMTGMKGAEGAIVAISDGPAYMVDYTSNDSSKMMVTNHKWLSQSEIESKK
ncbi:YdhK family protein [Streptococcaceae bacterium ESL0687]|nr:YdhK family protein [Streptococcaceae bacterium ESL0687]